MVDLGYTKLFQPLGPHLMTLLDEVPLPVVINAIQESAQRSPAATLRKMKKD